MAGDVSLQCTLEKQVNNLTLSQEERSTYKCMYGTLNIFIKENAVKFYIKHTHCSVLAQAGSLPQ